MQPVFLDPPSLRQPGSTNTGDFLNTSEPSGKVAIQDGRAFIPLASSGCGVGCKYCYIARPADAVDALSTSRMHDLLQFVKAYIKERPGAARPIVAIGCDTEISVSPAVLANAMMCLDFAIEYRLPVQIATKFPLGSSLRQRLEDWPLLDLPPVIFTTITTILLSARVEPNAPSPAERSANFLPHGSSWLSYALIKPFLSTSRADKQAMLNLLARQRPDGVVVGIRYRRSKVSNGTEDIHPVANDWIANAPSDSARHFIVRLINMGFRVFMNTQCVSAWHNSSSDGLIVKQKYPHLCVKCGRCP